MKKIASLISLFTFILITSCGQDSFKALEVKSDSAEKKIILGKTELSLFKGDKTVVSIKSGNGGYKLSSEDKSIAIAEMTKDGAIEIQGLKLGKTKIKVSDAKNKSTVISVVVNQKINAIKINALKVNVGVDKSASLRFKEKGSGDYLLSSSDLSIAIVKLNKGKVVLTGVRQGKAIVVIKDKKTNKTQKIEVFVKPVVKLNISDKEFINYKGSKEIRLYNGRPTKDNNDVFRSKSISVTGSGVYDVKVKEGSNFVKAEINEGVITVKSTDFHRSFGEAIVEVLDDALGEKVQFKVRTVLPLDISKNSITVDVNKNSEFMSFNQYSTTCRLCVVDHIDIKPKDASKLSVKKGEFNLLKGFTIVGKSVGDTSIDVSDGVQKITVKVSVLKDVLLPVEIDGGIVVASNQILELAGDESMVFYIKGSGDYLRTYENKFIKEWSFDKEAKKSKLVIKSGSKLGLTKVTIVDKVSKQKIVFSVRVKKGDIFNCDENGDFKYNITYKEAIYDKKSVAVKGKFISEGVYNCKGTITMKVGSVIDIHLCGGSANHRYEVYDQEGIVGNKREVVKIFNSKVKKKATSTITALKAGELIVYIRGYNKDKTLVNDYYRVLVID